MSSKDESGDVNITTLVFVHELRFYLLQSGRCRSGVMTFVVICLAFVTFAACSGSDTRTKENHDDRDKRWPTLKSLRRSLRIFSFTDFAQNCLMAKLQDEST